MTSPFRESVADLFAELAELPAPARAERLAALDAGAPALARELRALLNAEHAAGDFLGVLAPSGPDTPDAISVDTTSGPTIASGMQVGPYRIVRPLGRGGMATVWLAHDDRLDRPVALKLLSGVWSTAAPGGDDARSRLLAEARVAARLDHPHIAGIYDVGETAAGEPYIAMAYCEGGSLAERLVAGPLPLGDVLRIGRQLAAALAAAHERGIVHRDVKPANVLFDALGAVRLADFGIARLTDQSSVRSGAVVGTTPYLAPEQLRGEPVDHRADLWAFGVTLYEMLAGRRPFDGASSAAVLYGILATRPAPIARQVAVGRVPAAWLHIMDALEALVVRLLEKDAERRPRSAAEVERALERVRADAPVGMSETVGAPEHTGRAPLSTASPTAPRPTPLTPLIGRERELALAATLLERARLLTLTGPGGTGKTRLATELARLTSARYADGVHVVSLAATAAPDLVAGAIAQAIGLREAATARPGEQAMRYFANAHALLVLDNFEHVLAAAPLVAELLAAAPRLTVLVTSRAPLRLHGEQELPVPPLELPAPGATSALAIGSAEAVRLFVQRAQAGRPDFALTDDNAAAIAAICRRLDGLPLAIELAAARIKVLAPRALLTRLEQRLDLLRSDAQDVAPRHRTLRDVIDWSYALLAPNEQALLLGLSVFAGGFTLDAVAAMAAWPAGDATGTADAVEVLDRVAVLSDRSLLVRRDQSDGEPRFHMFETIREYSLARLREAGDEPGARAAHCAHFLALAEEAAPHLRGPSQVAWLERLEREHDNLRAALDHALAVDDVLSATRLAVALQWFWLGSRSFLGQTIARLQSLDERVRSGGGDCVPSGLHARLLTTLGLLTGVRGDHYRVPYRYYEASLGAYDEAGDADGMATALNHLGWTSMMLGDLDAAEAFSIDALARHTAANNVVGVATASVNLGWVSLSRGALANAERLFEEALAIHRRRGDTRACAYAIGHVASAAVRRGEHERALALYEEVNMLAEPLGDRILQPTFRTRLEAARYETGAPAAEVLTVMEGELLPRLREAGHAWSLGFVLACVGRIHRDTGAFSRARAAFAESLAVRRGAGDRSGVAETDALLAELERRVGNRAEAAELWRNSLRERHAMGEAVAVAECLEGIARIALDDGDDARAVHLLAGAAAERERLGAPVPPRGRGDVAAWREELERRLGSDVCRAAWAEGAAAPPDALVALAFDVVGE